MKGKYHVNPATGNPNKCRALKKCPFGGENTHYDTVEEARRAFEINEKNSQLASLRGKKLSKGAKLLLAFDHAQQVIAVRSQQEEAKGTTDSLYNNKEWSEIIDQRNYLKRKVERELPWIDDAPSYDDSVTVEMDTRRFGPGEDRLGYNKDSFTPSEDAKPIYEQLDKASAEWIRRLSTSEIKAIVEYNKDAEEYAKAVAGLESTIDTRVVKYFHSAMEKAPRAEKPFRVYAGISEKRCLETRAQCDQGVLELTRIQSATANPAQINGFTRQSDPMANGMKGTNDETAVEFEATRVASLSAFNVHKDEMELLLPPGRYEVTEKLHGLTYYWGSEKGNETKSGRMAETTYIVRELEDTEKAGE